MFLSGMGDMLAVSEGVREYVEAKSPRRWVVLMLHSSLSVEEQDKVRPTTLRAGSTWLGSDWLGLCWVVLG